MYLVATGDSCEEFDVLGLFSKLKTRLATIPETSWRYKMVDAIWRRKRIDQAKACKFYWVMIPSSVFLCLIFGIIIAAVLVIVFALIVPLMSFLGFRPVTEKSRQKMPAGMEVPEDAFFYPYGYIPSKGRKSTWQPWMVVPALGLPVLVISGVANGAASAGGSWLTGIPGWFSDNAMWMMAVAVLVLIFTGIGWLLTRNRQTLSTLWDRLCPDLTVEPRPRNPT